MSESLAPRNRLAARLPEPIETDAEIALADEMLLDASNEARIHGNQMWTPETVPSGVVTIVLQAAARGYMNPAGFSDEAADGTRFSRADEYARGTNFTPSEIRAVRSYAQRSGITYAQVTKPNPWRSLSDRNDSGTAYVQFEHKAAKPFPWLDIKEA